MRARPGHRVYAVGATVPNAAAADAVAAVVVSVVWLLVMDRSVCMYEQTHGHLFPGMSLLPQLSACSLVFIQRRIADGVGGRLDGRQGWSVNGARCRRTLCVTVRGSGTVHEQVGGHVYFDSTVSATVSVGGRALVPFSGDFL